MKLLNLFINLIVMSISLIKMDEYIILATIVWVIDFERRWIDC